MELIYKLWRNDTFLLSGSKEIIKLYLRICLYRWEELFIGDKRKQLVSAYGEDEKELRRTIRFDRSRAFRMWQRDMEEEHYRIVWVEDGKVYSEEDVVEFFLEDM